MYLLKLDIINANDEDEFRKIPLEYLILNAYEEEDRNKIIFLNLFLKTNLKEAKIKTIVESFNPWQSDIYVKFFKTPAVKLMLN